ncbi:PLxRFG domain-containing protein [Janthinobacterium sp. B9-8]|uniref:PLxRFG domain-containing protein n=1 Tax=Janthinobacterium sp. B9-8 TaxID=1236179 RepID=UPI00061D38E5|nr:PLxRFG domain-containing protein [Janthinobacterium sp. B9-8]AMC34721.1 hypothetical protein VN23_08925 [Janthinobacterium sp. B9-8]
MGVFSLAQENYRAALENTAHSLDTQDAPSPAPAASRTSGKLVASDVSTRFDREFDAAAEKYAPYAGVEPAVMSHMLKRIVSVESNFDPGIVNKKSGATGAGQIMPGNFSAIGITNPKDPAQNIQGAAYLLTERLRTHKGDWLKTVATYNGSGKHVQDGQWQPETLNYVNKIFGKGADQILLSGGSIDVDGSKLTRAAPPSPRALERSSGLAGATDTQERIVQQKNADKSLLLKTGLTEYDLVGLRAKAKLAAIDGQDPVKFIQQEGMKLIAAKKKAALEAQPIDPVMAGLDFVSRIATGPNKMINNVGYAIADQLGADKVADYFKGNAEAMESLNAVSDQSQFISNSVGRDIYRGVQSTAEQVLPAMGSGFNPAVMGVSGGLSQGGSAYNEARDAGLGKGDALANGIVQGGLEGIGDTIGAGAVSQVFKASGGKILSKLGRAVAIEPTQEMITQTGQSAMDQHYGTNGRVAGDWNEYADRLPADLQSAAIGGLVGAASFGGAGAAINLHAQHKARRDAALTETIDPQTGITQPLSAEQIRVATESGAAMQSLEMPPDTSPYSDEQALTQNVPATLQAGLQGLGPEYIPADAPINERGREPISPMPVWEASADGRVYTGNEQSAGAIEDKSQTLYADEAGNVADNPQALDKWASLLRAEAAHTQRRDGALAVMGKISEKLGGNAESNATYQRAKNAWMESSGTLEEIAAIKQRKAEQQAAPVAPTQSPEQGPIATPSPEELQPTAAPEALQPTLPPESAQPFGGMDHVAQAVQEMDITPAEAAHVDLAAKASRVNPELVQQILRDPYIHQADEAAAFTEILDGRQPDQSSYRRTLEEAQAPAEISTPAGAGIDSVALDGGLVERGGEGNVALTNGEQVGNDSREGVGNEITSERIPPPVLLDRNAVAAAAKDSHRHTSHTPERRAQQEMDGYVQDLQGVWDKVEPIYRKVNEEARTRIADEYADLVNGYTAKYNARLHARGNTASTMITGGSNFNVPRNNKRLETEQRRVDEAREFLSKGLKRLLKAAQGPIDHSPSSALAQAQTNLEQRERLQTKMKEQNALARKEGRESPYESYELTNNNAQIKRLKSRVAELSAKSEAAQVQSENGTQEQVAGDIRIVNDEQAQRVQLFFDGKPEVTTREMLKSHGFKWAPSIGAWQRQNTDNGLYAAQLAVKKITGESIQFNNGPSTHYSMSEEAQGSGKDRMMRAAKQDEEVSTNIEMPLHLSALNSQQRQQSQSSEFKSWFGDWQTSPKDASKVVNEHGEPLVVFHGANASEKGKAFSVFDMAKSSYGKFGGGGYFTSSPLEADYYSNKGKGNSPSVYPVFLDIKNPLDMDAKADPVKWESQFEGISKHHEGGVTNESWFKSAEKSLSENYLLKEEGVSVVIENLSDMGYDGISFMGNDGRNKNKVFVVFSPNQVKSAIGNNGTFSQFNPDIRYSKSERLSRSSPEALTSALNTALGTDTTNKLIDSGRLQFGEVEDGAQAKYDGETITLDSSKVGKDNALAVLLHEVSHASDANGGVFGQYYEAMQKTLSIWAKAKLGTPMGDFMAAVDERVLNSETTGNDALKERLAYAVEEAASLGTQAPRTVREWLQSVVNAVKTQLAKLAVKFKLPLSPNLVTPDLLVQLAKQEAGVLAEREGQGQSTKTLYSRAANRRDTAAQNELADQIARDVDRHAQEARGWTNTAGDKIEAIKNKFDTMWGLVKSYQDRLPEIRGAYDFMGWADGRRTALATEAANNHIKAFRDLATNDSRAADRLSDIMTQATLWQIHPESEVNGRWKPEWKAKHAELSNAFNALPQEAKDIYTATQEYYARRSEDIRNGLIERIKRLDMDEDKRAILLKDLQQRFDQELGDGPYFPLNRDGNYVVTGRRTVDGKLETVRLQYERREQADEALKHLQSRGFTTAQRDISNAPAKASEAQISGSVVGKLAEAIELGVSNKEQRDALLDTLNQTFIDALPSASARKHFMHRKGTPGYSLDMTRALAKSAVSLATQISNLEYSDQITDALDRAGKTAGWLSPVVDEVRARYERAVQYKTSKIAGMLQTGGFAMTLAFNVSSGLVNIMQQSLTLSELSGEFSAGKASAQLIRANKEIMASVMRDGGNHLFDLNKAGGTLSSNEKTLLTTLEAMGKIDISSAMDAYRAAHTATIRGNTATARGLEFVSNNMGVFMHTTEVVNRQATALAAFRLKLEKTGDIKAATRYAAESLDNTQFNLNISNMPPMLQNDKARVVLMYKSYAVNMLSFLGHNLSALVDPKKLGDRERAKRIMGTMVVAQTLAAGLTSLPMLPLAAGVGAAVGKSAVQFAGGNKTLGMALGAGFAATAMQAFLSGFGRDEDEPWDWKVEWRKWLVDHAGQDVGKALDRGVLSLLGVDIADRISMNDLVFREAKTMGFNDAPENWADAQALSLLGPVYGSARRVVQGTGKMAEGNVVDGAQSALPTALANVMKATRMVVNGGVVNPKTGVTVVETNWGEDAAQLLGLNPSVVREYRARESAQRERVKQLGARKSELKSAAIETLEAANAADGDQQETAQLRYEKAIENIAAFNERNPDEAITGQQIRGATKSRQHQIRDDENLPSTKREALDDQREQELNEYYQTQ